MRICIITQPLTANYGGLLQNYALQTVLKRMGHSPVTIDYIYKPTVLRYVLSICKTILLRCLGKKRAFIKYAYRRKPEVQKFINDYISVTDPVNKYTKEIIEREKADAIIVGSDQVWRAIYNPIVLDDMFLDFAKNLSVRKIAYAASFGIDRLEFTRKQIKRYSRLIKKFDFISVREESGVEICKKYFSINAEQVLDPTLLLDKSDYLDICKGIPVNSSKFIYAYILDASLSIKDTIREIANKKNLKVVYTHLDTDFQLSIEEWLANFRDAEYIITDSFHGTVFSIIFNKPFYTISNNKRGNARIESILSKFGMMSRQKDFIYNLDYIIDWSCVNLKREELLTVSIKKLKDALYF